MPLPVRQSLWSSQNQPQRSCCAGPDGCKAHDYWRDEIKCLLSLSPPKFIQLPPKNPLLSSSFHKGHPALTSASCNHQSWTLRWRFNMEHDHLRQVTWSPLVQFIKSALTHFTRTQDSLPWGAKLPWPYAADSWPDCGDTTVSPAWLPSVSNVSQLDLQHRSNPSPDTWKLRRWANDLHHKLQKTKSTFDKRYWWNLSYYTYALNMGRWGLHQELIGMTVWPPPSNLPPWCILLLVQTCHLSSPYFPVPSSSMSSSFNSHSHPTAPPQWRHPSNGGLCFSWPRRQDLSGRISCPRTEAAAAAWQSGLTSQAAKPFDTVLFN